MNIDWRTVGQGDDSDVASLLAQRDGSTRLLSSLLEQARTSADADKRLSIEQQNADTNTAYKKMAAESQAEARAERALENKGKSVDAVAKTLSIDDPVSNQLSSDMDATGRGDLKKVQPGHLASRAISGIVAAPSPIKTIPGITPIVAPPGISNLQSKDIAAAPDRTVFAGTAAQRASKALLDDPSLTDTQRNAIQYEMSTGRNAPAGYLKPEGATGPPTEAGLDSKYQDIVQKKSLGQPLSPEDAAYERAYTQRKTLAATTNFNLNQPKQADARVDKSFDSSTKRIDALRKPVADTVTRLSRLTDSINQNSPQADALIAPELMSAMAGGQGSGVRITDSEINRVLGGRSRIEDFKAWLNKFSLDPSQANSITPEQRREIRSLMSVVQSKANAKLSALDDADEQLIDAGDVDSHRRIVSGAKQKLTTIDTGGDAGGNSHAPGSQPAADYVFDPKTGKLVKAK